MKHTESSQYRLVTARRCAIALIALPALALATGTSGPATATKLRADVGGQGAVVSLNDARDIALHAHAGKITDEELEKERGGSGLRYSFDIQSQHKTYEVGVDAKTGKVLENKLEGSNPD